MKYDSPLVSVIITTYGRPKFLKNAIESVLCQSYKNIEIIVVDDNIEKSIEREATENLIKNNFQTIKYIKNKENRGACFSRNVGINSSKGEYIAFLDDDDEFFREKIEKQLIHLQKINLKDKKVSIISCQMRIINEEEKKIGVSKYNLLKEANDLKDFLNGVYISGTSSLLIEKKALLKVNGFSEIESCQEALLILKLLENGYKFSSLKEELVLYRKHNNGNIGKSSKARKGQKKYLEKIYNSIETHIDKRNQKKAKLNYYYSLFLFELDENKTEAIKIFYKICKINFFNKVVLKCFIKLILG